eukprot:1160114-Pelagomonas_calceolata.AAC.11
MVPWQAIQGADHQRLTSGMCALRATCCRRVIDVVMDNRQQVDQLVDERQRAVNDVTHLLEARRFWEAYKVLFFLVVSKLRPHSIDPCCFTVLMGASLPSSDNGHT